MAPRPNETLLIYIAATSHVVSIAIVVEHEEAATFGILLGYIVSARGIKPNPDKVSAITNMKRPTCVKDIQKFKGCMAALSCFMSRLGKKGLPFFKLLKASECFS